MLKSFTNNYAELPFLFILIEFSKYFEKFKLFLLTNCLTLNNERTLFNLLTKTV